MAAATSSVGDSEGNTADGDGGIGDGDVKCGERASDSDVMGE